MRQWLVLWMLVCVGTAMAAHINEVFYDPEGEEYGQEFVEVYGLANLSEYTFGDLSKNQTLVLRKEAEGDYALIVPDDFNHSEVPAWIYTAGSRLGNGLGNAGDAVFLYLNGTLVDSVTYNKSAVLEGYSLEWDEMRWKSSQEKGGTP